LRAKSPRTVAVRRDLCVFALAASQYVVIPLSMRCNAFGEADLRPIAEARIFNE
jgi:hypothetical protein